MGNGSKAICLLSQGAACLCRGKDNIFFHIAHKISKKSSKSLKKKQIRHQLEVKSCIFFKKSSDWSDSSQFGQFGQFGRICNPPALNISICNAIIAIITDLKS